MQKMPHIFTDKIAIDKRVSEVLKYKVVMLTEATGIIKARNDLRRRCQMYLSMHKVDQDGPGSPVAMMG